jgi:beta-galactosidase/beta-glucuronidase
MKIKILDKWRFSLEDKSKQTLGGADFWARDFDDSSWKEVTVPHDWAVSYPFDKSNSSGTGYLPGGTGWYRYHFVFPKKLENKNAFICFDGVYKHARVWCNGYYLGNWQNGYTSFSFNITEALKKDGTENVIVVCVDHPDIADCRWYTGSGIQRPVYLKYTENLSFTDDGVFFYTKNNDDIYIETKIQNLTEEDQEGRISVELKDQKDRVVYSFSKDLRIAGEKIVSDIFKTSLSDLNLWSPENPYLYKLNLKIESAISLSDEYSCNVGIRNIQFDPNKGMICNGKVTKLKGLCLHEDAGCFGNAVPKEVWKRRLEKLKSCGCNAIRMSHNPHSEELYELCDEMGFFVMDEIYDEWQEPKNKWWQGHNVYPPSHQGITDDFLSCYEKDCRAFVTKRRNHPSVIMWSIGNEIDYPNDPYCSPKFKEMTGNNDASKPAAERQYNPNHPDISQIRGIAKMLSREIKKWDITRPVTMALAFPELSIDTGVTDFLDVIGYNYKEQFYEEDHKRFPEKAILGSENHHSLEAWNAVKENDYIAGQFLWTGVDYLGEAKGWPVHGSPAGLLTMAGFEKPLYYFRKALWTEEETVKIFSAKKGEENFLESWNYLKEESIVVRAYTNAKEVELFLNGKTLGKKSTDGKYFVDFDIKFQPGELIAVAGKSQDKIITVGRARSLKADIIEGEELNQIEVTVLDDVERPVLFDYSMINVIASENIEILGLENGNLSDITPYTEKNRRALNGKLIIYAKGKNGTIKLSSEHLESVEVNL